MMMGDAAWSLIAQLSKEDAVLYLNDRQSRGFNAILVNLLEHKFASNAPANYYGDQPFTKAGDFSTPNEAYFAHAEYVLQQAQARGILVLLAPSYLGNGGGSEGWYQEMENNGPAKMRAYGQYVATRLAGLKNILWVNGGDWNPPDQAPLIALANGIQDINPKALQTVHCNNQTNARDLWANQSWLNIDTSYTDTNVYTPIASEYKRTPAMPVFLIETLYENESYGTPMPNEQMLRGQAFGTLLSGGFGHVYGNNPIWHFDGPGLFSAPYDWKTALSSRGAVSMTLVKSVLQRAGWSNLVPDLSNGFLTAGVNGTSVDDKALSSTTSNGSVGVVYIPSARAITVNLTKLAGPKLNFSWYDPSAGTYKAIDTTPVANTGSRTLTPPSKNAAGFSDWVLLVESTN